MAGTHTRTLAALVAAALLLAACGDAASTPTPPLAGTPPVTNATDGDEPAPRATEVTPTVFETFLPTPTVPAEPPANAAPTPTTPIAGWGNAEIYLVDVASGAERRLTDDPAPDLAPRWSPDGARLAWLHGEPYVAVSATALALADGSHEELLPPAAYPWQEFSWLPDGRIAFMTCEGSDCGVFTADPGGGNRQRLPAPVGGFEQLAWSPDGTQVAYVGQNETKDLDIWVIQADGTHPRALTGAGSLDLAPAWSPDGRSIVYRRQPHEAGESTLAIVDLAGGEPRSLGPETRIASDPVWSPDGTRIAYARQRHDTPDTDIWLIDADGTDARQLTAAPRMNSDPQWSPDGTTIAFASTRDGGQPVQCSFSVIADYAPLDSIAALAWSSPLIVVGMVDEVLPATLGSIRQEGSLEQVSIYTDYRISVERTLRGATGNDLRVRTMGGTVGNCTQDWRPHESYQPGQRVLVFLTPHTGDPALPAAYSLSYPVHWLVDADDRIRRPEGSDDPTNDDGMTLDEVASLVTETLAGDRPPGAWDIAPSDATPAP